MTANVRTEWHWFDNVILFLRIIWCVSAILEFVLYATGPFHWFLMLWIIASFFIPLFYFRPGNLKIHQYFLTEFTATGSLYIYLIVNGQVHALNLILIQVMMLSYLSSMKTKVIAVPLLILMIPLSNVVGQLELSVKDMVQKLFDFVLYFGLGICFQQIIRSNGIIQEKNKALEHHTKVIERLTVIEERNRLARDMHDTIGHTFVSTITGLSAIKYQMRSDPIEAEKSIDELLAVTRDGLQEIRKNIHQISDEDETSMLSDRLATLAERFGKYTNTVTSFQHTGVEGIYPESTNMVLTRCLQESLTNAKRHGLAPKIDVVIHFSDKEIELIVTDYGKGIKNLSEGFGIKAMRERLSTLRGSFYIRSQENFGTTVICKISLAGDV